MSLTHMNHKTKQKYCIGKRITPRQTKYNTEVNRLKNRYSITSIICMTIILSIMWISLAIILSIALQ